MVVVSHHDELLGTSTQKYKNTKEYLAPSMKKGSSIPGGTAQKVVLCCDATRKQLAFMIYIQNLSHFESVNRTIDHQRQY